MARASPSCDHPQGLDEGAEATVRENSGMIARARTASRRTQEGTLHFKRRHEAVEQREQGEVPR